MNVVVEVTAECGKTHCQIKLEGLPSCCESHELKEYLDANLPSLEEVSRKILVAHKMANTE